MLNSRFLAPCVWMMIGALAGSMANAQEMHFPQPEPRPAALPSGHRPDESPMLDLTRSHDYSAARISSYQRQGGPRDNFYIPTTGEEVTLADIQGPGAITHMWMTHRGGGHDLILRFYWEGSDHPSIEAPIGDFFGVAMGVNANMDSVPIQNSSEGRARNCWWNMPFNRSARVTASAPPSDLNKGRESVALYFYIDYRVYPQPIPDVHYFHARFLETDPPVRGQPVTLVEAQGDGHFVGVVLGSRARMTGWFGEGDDIITVDGQVSFLGTGTEDYFCDAWGFRQFSSFYHGAPVMEGRNVGDRLSAYRLHILDPIPFRRSFKFQIEHWPWDSPIPNSGRNYYSSLGYWYQKTVHAAWPRLERIIANEPWDPDKGRWHTPGALEAERLKVLAFTSKAGPDARPTPKKALPNLSGDEMLVFDSGGDGACTLAVPADQAGQYTVKLFYARAPEFGIVQLQVNGENVGEPVDTYLKRKDLVRPLWPPEETRIPGVKLKAGQNEFTFVVKSKNAKAEGCKVGLDCLALERAQ